MFVNRDSKTGEFVTGEYAEANPDTTERVELIERGAHLGEATTLELILELHARADVARTTGETWPNYRTVDS